LAVSVSLGAVNQAEKICHEAITELNNSSQRLNTRFHDAGQRWKDNKYKQLGVIIDDCSKAMRSPIDELFECINKLQALEKAILEYEGQSL